MRHRRKRIVAGVEGLVALLALVALNELAFRALLDTGYLRWYLANGALISLVFGFVTLAWGDLLNKQTYLISAHPFEYAGAAVTLLVLPFSALGAMLQARGRRERRAAPEIRRSLAEMRTAMEKLAATPGASEEMRKQVAALLDRTSPQEPAAEEDLPTGVPVIDLVLAVVFALAFLVVVVAWLLVVVPVQYFVNLVTGAPAREACASATRALYLREGNQLVFQEAWKDEPLPEGAVESGFSARPVSFTAAITAGTLFVASQLVG